MEEREAPLCVLQPKRTKGRSGEGGGGHGFARASATPPAQAKQRRESAPTRPERGAHRLGRELDAARLIVQSPDDVCRESNGVLAEQAQLCVRRRRCGLWSGR